MSTAPAAYTHPDVLTRGAAEGWADAETDPARIDWAERKARAVIPFDVVNGRPVNPCETTAVPRGRNEMGRWGENLMADAVVYAVHAGVRHLLMVERDDGWGWAVPGGKVEPGEDPADAAIRELREETSLAEPVRYHPCPARYVPDPRASGEAWAVTVPVVGWADAEEGLPAVSGADDARRAAWVPAGTFDGLKTALHARYGGHVFTAHVPMLTEFLAE